MIITFCGHSDFYEQDEYQAILTETLSNEVGDAAAEMYLGGYGRFDAFAYDCCRTYKKTNPSISLVFVTPYLQVDEKYENEFDSVLYPPIEDKPLRFAISYRNQYMVDKSDLVIACVDHEWGGAYKTLCYAKKKGKRIINLAKIKKR